MHPPKKISSKHSEQKLHGEKKEGVNYFDEKFKAVVAAQSADHNDYVKWLSVES